MLVYLPTEAYVLFYVSTDVLPCQRNRISSYTGRPNPTAGLGCRRNNVISDGLIRAHMVNRGDSATADPVSNGLHYRVIVFPRVRDELACVVE